MTLLRSLAVAICTLWVGLAAMAEDRPVVLELYTSQGCNACPPADNLLTQLSDRDDIIALALHVDYWDYIGWKDMFADPSHGLRQKEYAYRNGHRMVYTPQMIVGGEVSLEGERSLSLLELIAEQQAAAPMVALSISRSGDTLTINARPLQNVSKPVAIHLVRFNPEQTVQITRGENRGKTLTYSNIVTSWDTVDLWDGAEPISLKVDTPGDARIAVILQEEDLGPIHAAAQLK
ncbi:MAG: DUF1223 domain-containing protein [Pseudomonadota bacterium]